MSALKLCFSPADQARWESFYNDILARNKRFTALLADYLNKTPRLISARMVKKLAEECTLPKDDAFRVLLAAAIGLDTLTNAEDKEVERRYLIPSLHRLNPKEWQCDAYLTTIDFPRTTAGAWSFGTERYAPYEPFVCGLPQQTEDGREIPQLGYFTQAFSFPAVRENGSGAERVLQALTAFDTALPSAAQLAARLGMEETRLAPELDALLAHGEAAAPLPGRFIASAVLDALWARCEALLTDYHAKNPLHAGIRAAELRQRLFRAVEPERADALLALFVREGKLRFAAERYALADFTVRYTRRQTALRAELLALYRAADLRPERTDRVLACFDAKDRAEAERVLESLLTGGELIALAPRLCLHREVYVCACALVRAYFADHETLTLAAFRDLLGTSRDSALLVLECLDRNDRTRREGDLRRPGRRLYE